MNKIEIRRYLVSGLTGIVFIVCLVFILVIIKGKYGTNIEKAKNNIYQNENKLLMYERKSRKISNDKWISQIKEIEKWIKKQKNLIINKLLESEKEFESYFGEKVGTTQQEMPSENHFKERYMHEVEALLEEMRHTSIKIDASRNESEELNSTSLTIESRFWTGGKPTKEEIPRIQKEFWIQKAICEAAENTHQKMEVIVPKYIPIKEYTNTSTSTEGKKEALYKVVEIKEKKDIYIEKIKSIKFDRNLICDPKKIFRLIPVTIQIKCVYSLVGPFIENLLKESRCIFYINSFKIIGLQKTGETTVSRYKEPSVDVEIKCFVLDLLSEQEKEKIKL